MVNIKEKIDLLRFRPDTKSHIAIKQQVCSQCQDRPCLFVCPAGMFSLSSENEILYNHEGCLECGTCYVACEKKSVTWNYPRGGRGVCFREA